MRLVCEVAGDVQMNHELLAIAGRVVDVTPVWLAMIEDLEVVEREQFDTQGAYASGGWAQLSERWLAFKTTHGYDTRILRMTGALFDSVTSSDADYAVRRVTPMSLTFGTSRPFAGVHQNPPEGSPIPQRRFLELTMERREAYVRAMLGWARTGNPARYLRRR